MIKVAVMGATGYAGQELLRLLVQHPEVELEYLVSTSYADKSFAHIYPHFRNVIEMSLVNEDLISISENVDLVFLALPHGLSSAKVNKDTLANCKIIDLGADFRLKDLEAYETWYQCAHGNPELLPQSVYGLPEWNRKQIAESRLVANPGCYATCTLLSLLPLVKAEAIDFESIVVDAKSGVSGSGRAHSLSVHYNEVNENIKAYKIAEHRHTPEIEQTLSLQGKKPITITFTPHLVPMNRGILITAYAKLRAPLSTQEVFAIYEQNYANEPFIRLSEIGGSDMPETRWVKGSNFCDIGFAVDTRCNRVVVVGALDNLVKGAAGQAVQNMNIIFGLPETTGINHIPVFPA